MKKYLLLFFINFYLSFSGFAVFSPNLDSIGTIIEGGEKYILHEVESGETLYAISRIYGVDVQSIKDANNNSTTSLKIGQKVLVPIIRTMSEVGDEGIIHVVKSSETLFSISRQYNVKLDDLKRWNNLSENSISIGQKLIIKESGIDNTTKITQDKKVHVVEQSQTLYSISKIYGVTATQLRDWNELESDVLNIGQTLIVSSSVMNESTDDVSNSSMLPENASKSDKPKNKNLAKDQSKEAAIIGTTSVALNDNNDRDKEIIEAPAEKIKQKGFAEVIEKTSDTKKYLALHRNAPVGTIMQVRNEMNNQSVFVRIVGSISPTGDNSKVILKISQKAYDRLGAVDSRFPVEISYIP